MGQYDNLTKQELIQLLIELEQKRAFSYEDQLKLIILDKSPFTMWASDRNCIIRMWEGQCESMYGRKKEDVLGQDFVDLFVARDEQPAARRDQLEIIDKGKEFHNIANDQGRNGNTLQLITNCFRVKDPRSGEYWNAEMGIAIDYYEEEKEQLARNVEEGRLIQSLISDFSETQYRYREQFGERKEALLTAIRSSERKAAQQGKLNEYRTRTKDIKAIVLSVEEKIDAAITEYYNKMKNCTSSSSCSEVKRSFNTVLRKLFDDFDDVILEIDIINCEFQETVGIVTTRDEVMKTTTAKNSRLEALAQEMWLKAEEAVREYQRLGEHITSDSIRLGKLKKQRDDIKELKDQVHDVCDDIYSQLSKAKTEESIRTIKETMEYRYSEIETKLQNIRRDME